MKVGKDVVLTPKKYYKSLQQITSGRQQQFYVWVLTRGESFQGRKLTREEEEYFKKLLHNYLYNPRHCIYNAQMIAIYDESFQYYEGQASNKKIPFMTFEHAWLVRDGKVYDPTWNDGVEYHGIHIPTHIVRSNIAKTKTAESLMMKYYISMMEKKSINVM